MGAWEIVSFSELFASGRFRVMYLIGQTAIGVLHDPLSLSLSLYIYIYIHNNNNNNNDYYYYH